MFECFVLTLGYIHHVYEQISHENNYRRFFFWRIFWRGDHRTGWVAQRAVKFNWPFGNITYAKKTASSSSDADSTCMTWHDGFGLRAEVRFGMLCQGSV